jgi:hypothetical protein
LKELERKNSTMEIENHASGKERETGLDDCGYHPSFGQGYFD